MNNKFITSEIDKQGNVIDIIKTDNLRQNNVYVFFLRHMAELIESGYSFPATIWEDQYLGAVYAEKDGKILGLMVWDTENLKKTGTLWILLSAVAHEARGRGIYTILHKHFEDVAREKNCWAIISHIHKDNISALNSAKSVGRTPIFYCMGKRLK